MEKYKILPIPGKRISIPYILSDITEPLIIEHSFADNIFTISAARGEQSKKITTIHAPGNNAEITAVYGIKSPFEEQLLVIIQVKAEHLEFDYPFFSFYPAGCHIRVGLE